MTDQTAYCRTPLRNLLGLKVADHSTAYGAYRRYPIAITVLGGKKPVGLLLQLRHIIGRDEVVHLLDSTDWQQAIGHLTTDHVEIELEEQIVWATFSGPEFLEDNTRVLEVIDGLLEVLPQFGVVSTAGLCHYCERNRTSEVVYAQGRVAQICPTCLAEKHSTLSQMESGLQAGLILAAAGGAFFAATLWFAVWSLQEQVCGWLFGDTPSRAIYVPHIAEIVALSIVAALVAIPASCLFIKLCPSSTTLSRATLATCVAVGAVVGECFLFGSRLPARLSPALFLRVYWASMPGPLLVYRACSLMMAAMFSVRFAYPRRAKLDL